MKIQASEHRIAMAVVKVLVKEDISHGQAKRILKDVKNELKKLPVKEKEYLSKLPEK